MEALEDIRASFPVPLKGIDSDNGGEFINNDPAARRERRYAEFTRSRPTGKTTTAACRFFRPLLNCFEPTVKLTDKIRAGDKVRKADDKPMSQYRRLIAPP